MSANLFEHTEWDFWVTRAVHVLCTIQPKDMESVKCYVTSVADGMFTIGRCAEKAYVLATNADIR